MTLKQIYRAFDLVDVSNRTAGLRYVIGEAIVQTEQGFILL